MHTLYFVLLLAGGLCFLVAAVGHAALTAGRQSQASIALVPLGLLVWLLVPLIQQGRLAFNH